jgi:Ca-activated chloride channel family protein
MLEQLSEVRFLRPEWLWLLLPAGLLYLVVLRREDVSKRWQAIIAPTLLSSLLIGKRRRWRFRPVDATCLSIVLAAIAMAGPTWTREQPPFTEDKAPLVIALDLSRDMDAIDLQPTRLERAKLKINDLLKARAGSRTALFVYGATAHMVVPLAGDDALMDLYLQSLSTDLVPAGRKNTAGALQKIEAFLQNETTPGTILFVTNGIEQSAFAAFARYTGQTREQVLVLGIGTAQGGPLRGRSGQFVTEYGRRVFSKLDIAGLKALKAETGIPVSTLTLDDADVKWIQRHSLSHLEAVQQQDAAVRWVDQGYWLVIPIAALSALWFRKGWTIRWTTAACVVVLLCHTPGAKAAPFRFVDLWLTPDQQGRYFYEKGDYATAAERFQDPMWKGLALCRNKDYARALDQFALIDTAESWFNQGNALAQLGKYPDAAKAYTEALKQHPNWKEAEDNLKLVRSLIPPPKPPSEEEEAPNLKPDQVKFDEKGKKGKNRLTFSKEEMADVWMRNIQTSPAEFLRRKFEIESSKEQK